MATSLLFHPSALIKTMNAAKGNEEKVNRLNKNVIFMIILSWISMLLWLWGVGKPLHLSEPSSFLSSSPHVFNKYL